STAYALAATSANAARDLRLIELERLVQHAHGELGVLLLDHHGDLDLGGRDHLDVDALLRQGAEHLRGDAGVRAHAHADDRHLGDLLVAGDVAALDVRLHLAFEDLHRLGVVAAVHGEGHVGHAVVT